MGIEKLDTIESVRFEISILEEKMRSGDGIAAFHLSIIYSPDSELHEGLKNLIPVSESRSTEIIIKAYDLLLKQSLNGNAEAMYMIGLFFQAGFPPVTYSVKECLEWWEKAFAAGYKQAGEELCIAYGNQSSICYNLERSKEILKLLQGI